MERDKQQPRSQSTVSHPGKQSSVCGGLGGGGLVTYGVTVTSGQRPVAGGHEPWTTWGKGSDAGSCAKQRPEAGPVPGRLQKGPGAGAG